MVTDLQGRFMGKRVLPDFFLEEILQRLVPAYVEISIYRALLESTEHRQSIFPSASAWWVSAPSRNGAFCSPKSHLITCRLLPAWAEPARAI